MALIINYDILEKAQLSGEELLLEIACNLFEKEKLIRHLVFAH